MKLFKDYQGEWVLLVRPERIKTLKFLRLFGFWFLPARIGKDTNWVKMER